MRFARPDLLGWLAAVPAAAALLLLAAAGRRRALARFAGGASRIGRFGGDASPHRRAVKAILLLAAIAMGCLAAARPQWGAGLEALERRGIDVVFVLDTSRSMAAADVPPNRLSLAKAAAMSLLDRLANDRVALVTFAGKAAIACPLTLDHGALRLLLDATEIEEVPVPGTALADAAALAVEAFGPPGREPRSRVVVLLSDGEDHEGGVASAASKLREAGVVLHALGIGTDRGAPIPDPEASGEGAAYKRDREGRIVTTRLDGDTLGALATETRGRFYRATPAGGELDDLARAISEMEAGEAGTVLRTRWEERFQWPLGLALAALAAEALVSDRRRRGNAS
jgi:Ca-activated chloride channel family protein